MLVTLSQQADQDGTILVYPALIEEASTGEYHSAWHNGDVSYARGMAWQVRGLGCGWAGEWARLGGGDLPHTSITSLL